MKFKRLLSGISAFAVAASAFAGLAVTANAADPTVIYERGMTTTWSETDIEDWNWSGNANAKASINPDHGLYADNNQTGYGTKTFTLSDSAVVTYDVDFYTASSPGRTTNYAYVKFGSNVTVGYNSNYNLYYSVDGGSSYNSTALTGNVSGKTTHIQAVINTSSNILVSLTVGGTEVASAANTVLSNATYNSVSMGFVRAGSVNWNIQYGLQNVNISETVDETVYHIVTFDVAGQISTQSIADDANVSSIPDTTNHGYIFKGWTMDDDTETLYTTEDVEGMTITADTKFTAKYDVDEAYVEAIESVSITGAGSMTFGPDPDTAESNPYTVVIKGVDGTNITEENLSANVTDFNVVWDIDGFATENDTEGQYCDSYGSFAVNDSATVATDFELKNVPMNFYGVMTATIAYNGETYTAKKSVVALGNKTVATNQILPEGGYPSDFDVYPDSLISYAALEDQNAEKFDAIVGGWAMAGSDGNKSAVITAEGTNKFIRISGGTSSKSHMFGNAVPTPSTQVIFEQNVRFNSNGGCITLTSRFPMWSSGTGYANQLTLSYNGSTVTLNGTAITDDNDQTVSIASGTWYKVVISVDPTTSSSFTKIYDAEGVYIGGADNVAMSASFNGNTTYYSVGMGNSNTGSIDFDNYSAYYPIADSGQYTLTASQDTLSIPNGDMADLAAALKTADGYEMTGAATWTVLEDDMKEGIIVTPDESDSHKATVALGSAAEAGTATVQVNIGGYTKTITLNITSSAESVKFTQSNSSISIPLDDKNTTAEYNAIVVDGNGTDLNRMVTYAIYDKNNTTVYTLPTGITFENGVLTVTKNAPAVTFTIRATGKNTDNEDISKSVKVTVHGLSFDFGAGADDDISEGYTSVSPDTTYTETRGYGVDSGSVTAGGTASVTNANEDYLEGAFTFKANVQKGKNYTVDITYQGKLVTGYVNSDLAGYTLGEQESLATASYIVPVPVDTLDLAVSGDGAKIAAITVTKNTDKTANVKPNIFHVGDSTAANNGSWAYVFNNTYSSYEDFAGLATFSNNGAGGRNLCTYYTQGKLASVLRAIKPGDIMMFGNNGTNGMGSYFETDVNYYLDAAEAMGAKIIINSYTPHGAVGSYASGYDSATHTFDSYRKDSYDNIVRKVAEEREESDPNYLGFVEIGKNADAAFNAYVADYAENGYDSADAAAQAIIACFSDHNHYSEGSVARNLMLNGYGDVNGIAAQLVAILSSNTPEPPAEGIQVKSFGELVSYPEAAAAGAEVTNNTDEAITVDVIMAEHDADGKLVRVSLNAVEIAAGATEAVSASINIMNDDWTTIKAYLWNASANNTPLANVLNVVDKGTYQ